MKIKELNQNIAFCLTLAVTLLSITNCVKQNQKVQKVFPGKAWEEKTPESQGIDPIILDSALNYLNVYGDGAGTCEMAIVRHGYLVWKGSGVDHKHEIYSCTKTFTSTVLGVLATEGKLKVNDPAVKYYPELAQGNQEQEVYKQIRLCDFATMTSGYKSIAGNCWDLHEKGLYNEGYDCTQQFTIPGKPGFPPRTVWQYDDQDVHMLGYILTKIAGKSLKEVFKEGVADKIGMTNWDWSDYGDRDGMFFNNPAGTPNNDTATAINDVQGGIWTTATEFARFGLLYLNKGKWGNTQVLDSSFAEAAISNHVPVSLPFRNLDLTGRYGYYWWTNGIRKDGTRPWPSAPPKTATGNGGGINFCFVIPEWDMVITRMSPRLKGGMAGFGDPVWEGFFKILKEGIECDEKQQQKLTDSKVSLARLKISSDHRYLVTENKKPFYLLGGTAWTMPENCTREDVDFYLNDRKEKGFNYVQVVAARDLNVHSINETLKYGTMNPENKYGFRPFEWNANQKADVSRPITVEGGTPTRPNDYWDHLEYIVQKTESLGMYIGVLPTWGRYYINNSIPEMNIFSVSNAKSYGRFLGERFKAYPHIIWILGGDVEPVYSVEGRPVYRSLAEGIAQGVTGESPAWIEDSPVWGKLMITYHGRNAAAEYFNDDAWLRLNMLYNDDPHLHGNVSTWYNNTPTRPMIEGEAWYEGWVWNGTYKPAKTIRRQMYHTFFGGALGGYVYGVASTTETSHDLVLKFQPGWRNRLDLEGANDVRHLKALLDKHKWWEWEPDQDIITDGKGNGESLKTACRSTSGNELLVYFADTSKAVVDLNKITSSQEAKVSWFDPTNGNTEDADKFGTNKAMEFKPPKEWEDAVLIIEGN